MRYSELERDQFSLIFGVLKSDRYHSRRRSFYERLHKTTNVAAIATAGFAFLSLSDVTMPRWSIWLAGLSALLSVLDLVIGFSKMADCHRELAKRFGHLQLELIEAFSLSSQLDQFEKHRIEIERDEPPIYRVLDLLSHIETAVALGCEADIGIKLRFYHRWTAQWLMWSDIATKRVAASAPC